MITASSPYFYTFWIPPICLEAILFGLALRAGIKWHISGRTDVSKLSGLQSPGLWFLLLRDSILFPFLCVQHFFFSTHTPMLMVLYSNLLVYTINLMLWIFLAVYSSHFVVVVSF